MQKIKTILKNSIFYVLLLIAIGIKLYYDSQRGNISTEDIIKNGVISKCKIVNATYFGKNNTNILYIYVVRGKEYRGEYVSKYISPTIDKSIKGKQMPLIYSNNNPYNSALLLRPNNFKIFNLSYPDSLNWINKFESKY